ncbi:MAG: hypothetical protein ABIZ80_05870, partial [Bryobacteraceae bacterium]
MKRRVPRSPFRISMQVNITSLKYSICEFGSVFLSGSHFTARRQRRITRGAGGTGAAEAAVWVSPVLNLLAAAPAMAQMGTATISGAV